jgi:integrase
VPVPEFVLIELSQQCNGKGPGEAVRRAEVQKITPHDLRHTYASLAVAAGVNALALQRMLGHASAKITLNTYADLFDDDLDAVADTLHARYSGESVGKMWSRADSDDGQ